MRGGLLGALGGGLGRFRGLFRDLRCRIRRLSLGHFGGCLELLANLGNLFGGVIPSQALLVASYALQVMTGFLRDVAQHGRLVGFLLQGLLRRLRGVFGNVRQRLLHGRALGQLLLQFGQSFLRIVLRVLLRLSQLLRLVVSLIQGLLHAELLLHLRERVQILLRHLFAVLHLGKVLRKLLQSIGRLLLRLRGILQGFGLRLRLLGLLSLLQIRLNLRRLLAHGFKRDIRRSR